MVNSALIWLSIITYPLLFIEFSMLAILALVDNAQRLGRWERMAFHATLALLFAILALSNAVHPIIPATETRPLIRLLSIPLLVVSAPSTVRSIIILARYWLKRRRNESALADDQGAYSS